MDALLFADEGHLLERPSPCARPAQNGYYWIKSSVQTNRGWTKPVWSLARYTKEGHSGFRDCCLTTIISGSPWKYGGHGTHFWGDEDFGGRYWESVVVDFEGPVQAPNR